MWISNLLTVLLGLLWCNVEIAGIMDIQALPSTKKLSPGSCLKKQKQRLFLVFPVVLVTITQRIFSFKFVSVWVTLCVFCSECVVIIIRCQRQFYYIFNVICCDCLLRIQFLFSIFLMAKNTRFCLPVSQNLWKESSVAEFLFPVGREWS